MPKINVYLPDDLAAEVKQAQLPVSAICQRALRDTLDHADVRTGGLTAAELPLSPHVASIIGLAPAAAARRGHSTVSSEDLLQAMIDEGESLILHGVEHLGFPAKMIQDAINDYVDRADPVEETDVHFGPDAVKVVHTAREDAIASEMNIVNGGNLLWALMTTPDGCSRKILEGIGLTQVADHKILGLIDVGYAYGRRTLHGASAITVELAKINERLAVLEREARR